MLEKMTPEMAAQVAAQMATDVNTVAQKSHETAAINDLMTEKLNKLKYQQSMIADQIRTLQYELAETEQKMVELAAMQAQINQNQEIIRQSASSIADAIAYLFS